MAHTRAQLAALLAALILASCNQVEQGPGAPAAPALTEWSAIPADDLRIPDGITYTTVQADGATVADISNVPEDAVSSGYTGGVGVTLPDGFEQTASGSQVRITVKAAAATEPGATLGVAYSTSEVGNSGWQEFPITTTPAEYSFTYDVPPLVNGNGDYVGFRSYGGDHVRIYGYRVEVVGPSAPAPTTP